MLFIGPAAELRFGRRHFMDMTAVFTGPPEFTVFAGRTELGRIDPSLLTEEVSGDRLLLLGGRSWHVTYIDWRRRRCFVEPADGGGKARWTALGWSGLGFELTRAIRDVLLGADPPVKLTKRAASRLAILREERLSLVHPGGNVIVRDRTGTYGGGPGPVSAPTRPWLPPSAASSIRCNASTTTTSGYATTSRRPCGRRPPPTRGSGCACPRSARKPWWG